MSTNRYVVVLCREFPVSFVRFNLLTSSCCSRPNRNYTPGRSYPGPQRCVGDPLSSPSTARPSSRPELGRMSSLHIVNQPVSQSNAVRARLQQLNDYPPHPVLRKMRRHHQHPSIRSPTVSESHRWNGMERGAGGLKSGIEEASPVALVASHYHFNRFTDILRFIFLSF